MTLKNKISFLISLVFSILFAIAAFIIFYLFSNFRKVEFESRLKEKAFSSIKLLVEVAQVDRQLLKIIDQNSINKLYDEKTLIFDSSYQLIYSSLDDAKIKWKDVFAGSLVTAILFMLGKFLISFYISKTDIGSTYGTAGSLVILLVWIYYSSFILYFGAEFTKAWAMKYGDEIHPDDYTILTQKIEVEKENKSMQQSENEKEDLVEKVKEACKDEDCEEVK